MRGSEFLVRSDSLLEGQVRVPTLVGHLLRKSPTEVGTLTRVLYVHGDSIGLFGSVELLQFPARLFHLALKILDLNQVLRVKRQRGVITIRLVRAEATISGLFP